MNLFAQIKLYLDGIADGLPLMPAGIEVLFPFQKAEVQRIVHEFYQKYYNDTSLRTLILGINPGRHGAGLTGIPFTDSKRLQSDCGISTNISSHETSSEFIYHMISRYGGPSQFYRDYFISSISPVGFIKDGKNFNYYDEVMFTNQLHQYIVFQMQRLLELPLNRKQVICFGEGKNYQFLLKLNSEYQWFDEIIPLAHPRFIMQYKRKELGSYTDTYVLKLKSSKPC
ncbi:MAG: DUF4918 family protein [Saprospiraceae bacterium]|nr:DUF4918 family protein [Saprospiraceae bacterium]